MEDPSAWGYSPCWDCTLVPIEAFNLVITGFLSAFSLVLAVQSLGGDNANYTARVFFPDIKCAHYCLLSTLSELQASKYQVCQYFRLNESENVEGRHLSENVKFQENNTN